MAWQGIIGHDTVVEQFRRSLEHGRLASTFLFVGPQGIGKRMFALKFAQALLCSASDPVRLEPCNACPECQQVMSDSHPDLQVVAKPEDKLYIPVSTFIGERERRMREGLCHFISLTPSGGKRRIAIIDDADHLNQEGANSLLKTLEEPSPGAVIILLSTSVQRQLPTIRSRSQVVQFQPLSDDQVAEALLQQQLATDADTAAGMASRSQGSISRSIALSDPDVLKFRQALFEVLAASPVSRKAFTQCVNDLLSTAGKDNAKKRRLLRPALQATMDLYQGVLRALAGATAPTHDAMMTASVEQIVQHGILDAETAAAQIDRCVQAMNEVDRIANPELVMDAWTSDIANSAVTNRPSPDALRI